MLLHGRSTDALDVQRLLIQRLPRLIPAALVPRPWDFVDEPVLAIQPAPSEDPAAGWPKSSDGADSEKALPTTPPLSPPLPSSRPASPPTLLPPLTLHDSAFGDDRLVTSADVPEVEDVAVVEPEQPTDGDAETLPDVTIVPPTPTSNMSVKSDDTIQPTPA